MPDEKYLYENLPIPSYDEATSSRGPTPRTNTSNEAANNQERQGLLGSDLGGRVPVPTRRAGYRPPASDDNGSVRESLDEVDYLDGHDGRESISSEDIAVRREMEEMEMLDPPAEQSAWGKRISSLSQTLHLPFQIKLPNWKFEMPRITANFLITCGRIIALILIFGIVYVLFVSDIFTNAASRMAGQMFDPESVRNFVQQGISAEEIRSYLQHITSYDHIAGTEGDYALSKWVEEKFLEANLEQVWVDEFGVYLNYPKEGGRAVEILDKDGGVKWAAKIEEEQAYPDEPRQQPMVFHGHSKTGDVKGPLMYANYGSREDFKRFYDSGIDTTGAIALVRYYGSQTDRSLKVKAAEEAGFIGCIIYSDPAEDGFVNGEPFPDGRYMPADGVQRGSVAMTSYVVGDVLTPGWPSRKGQLRLQPGDSKGLNNIPSIPLSWRDAQPLLQALKGFGQAAPPEWQGGVPDVEWWSGNLSSPIVHLKNDQDEVIQQPIWNVMGRIHGVEQREKMVIVGNHRDAWGFGAVDPGSGTAVMLEVVRVFGLLLNKGWRPKRSIVFASWDGEEYNLIGSTEFVEDNMAELRRDAYAYINVDVAVQGQVFKSAASPVFKKTLMKILGRTIDPATNNSMRKVWDDRHGELEGLGAGSDYVAFQDMAGTSSIDMGFEGPPFPYHSVYDNFEWMDKFGDPGFQYHEVLGQIWALLILDLADRPILPFGMEDYSSSITQYTMALENFAENKAPTDVWNIEPLREAVLQLQREVQAFSQWESKWENEIQLNGFESRELGPQRLENNNRMADFDRNLLDLENGGGLVGRDQFKHILYAPQLWGGYDTAFFPAIRDAIEVKDWDLAQLNVNKAAMYIRAAGKKLNGEE